MQSNKTRRTSGPTPDLFNSAVGVLYKDGLVASHYPDALASHHFDVVDLPLRGANDLQLQYLCRTGMHNWRDVYHASSEI